MKIAISGKGGVGKTLLAALISKIFAESGYSVLAIDADPDANLAATLGFPHPERITPISEMSALIEERTGVQPGKTAPFFKFTQSFLEDYTLKVPISRLEIYRNLTVTGILMEGMKIFSNYSSDFSISLLLLF